MQTVSSRVVVLGAGIAGLLAAQVAAEHFNEVAVLDSDELHETHGRGRRGTPQATQTHVLLPAGAAVLEQLFPGKVAELVDKGAQAFDYGQSRFKLNGRWMPRIDTSLRSYAQSRSLLENSIRSWVSANPRVQLLRLRARKILTCGDQVAGVECRSQELGDTTLLSSLIIDATGRHSKLSIEAYARLAIGIDEIRVGIDVGYTSCLYRLPPHLMPMHPLTYVVGPPPVNKRVGAAIGIEDGLIHFGFAGYHGDHPPREASDLLEYASGLSDPLIHGLLSVATPAGTPHQYRVPITYKRNFARCQRLIAGLLPIGDTICSLDPVFAQGMSIAALEASHLAACLQNFLPDLAAVTHEYVRAVEPIVTTAWNLSSGEDFRFVETSGRRPRLLPCTRIIKDLMLKTKSRRVQESLYQILSLAQFSGHGSFSGALLARVMNAM